MIVIVDGQEIDTSVVVDEEELTLDRMDGFKEIDELEDTIEFDFEDLDITQEFDNLEDTLDLGELSSDK